MKEGGEAGEWESLVLLRITGGALTTQLTLFTLFSPIPPAFACLFPSHCSALSRVKISSAEKRGLQKKQQQKKNVGVQSGPKLYRRWNFIFLRGSHEGFIQFPSTLPCWFNLFFRQTSQKGMSAFLHLNWPSADLSLSSLSNANNRLKATGFALCSAPIFVLQYEHCSNMRHTSGFNWFLFCKIKQCGAIFSVWQHICTRSHMLFIHLQLAGDLSTYYTWACALTTHADTHFQFAPSGILRRHTCGTALVAGAVMAVLKGWERARPCQTADGWTHGLRTLTDEHTHKHTGWAWSTLGWPVLLGSHCEAKLGNKVKTEPKSPLSQNYNNL